MNKTCTTCNILKPHTEFNKRIGSKKDGLQSLCKTCHGIVSKRWKENNTDKLKDYEKARYWANPEAAKNRVKKSYSARYLANPEGEKEKSKKQGTNWRRNNPEGKRKIDERYRSKHAEDIKERATARRKDNPEEGRKSTIAWNKANPERRKEIAAKNAKAHPEVGSAKASKHRAKKRNQSPLWREDAEIKLIYKKARDLTMSTGILYHVDHIVPIDSFFVSGFDSLANYQILTAKANQSKGNRWWPDMPDYSQVIYDPVTNTLIDKV
jgi:5-methylcytosine-specific restriction endonuclease McrA